MIGEKGFWMFSARTKYIALFILGLVIAVAGFLTYRALFLTSFDSGAPLLVSAAKEGRIELIDEGLDVDKLPLGWGHRTFFNTNATQYKLVEIDDKQALHCATDNGGSILARDMSIKLADFPMLNWQWKIEKPLISEHDEATEKGDDHPARFFVMFSNDDGSRKAAEIIWSNKRYKPGDYKIIGNFYHLVANGLDENIGKWHDESVDLVKFYRDIGGESANPSLSLLGFFCDSDNTGGSTSAYFANVYLAAQ